MNRNRFLNYRARNLKYTFKFMVAGFETVLLDRRYTIVAIILLFVETTIYNGPRELDHGIEKMREHGIMRLSKGRSANHVIQNVHVGIQGEGSH